jgi:alcohol dehydrogenase
MRLAGIFDGIKPHVPEEVVYEGVEVAKRCGADGLLAIGGGASIDTAKAIALLLAEGGEPVDHQVVFIPPESLSRPSLIKDKLPIVAIPLTLSGAEATAGISVNSRRHGKKINIYDPGVRPRVILQDPQLAMQVSGLSFGRSGLNALANCVEIQCARRRQPYSTSRSEYAANLLGRWLISAVQKPDVHVRGLMLAASYLAVSEFGSTGGGVVHGICHAITGIFDEVPHGDCYGVLLPAGMEFNLPASLDAQAALGRALGAKGISDGELARGAADCVRKLRATLGGPSTLREIGIPRDSFEKIAELSLTYYAVADNPVPIESPQQITQILEAAW